MDKSDSRALYDMKLTTGMAYIYGPEGKKAHAQAIQHDKDKSYRLVVNIVGKVAQGKTSLRRLLVGEDFNEREESTVGIEHELVETLGTSPSSNASWTKVDLRKANVEECDLIVGKHVRERLQKSRKGQKHKDEIKSFFKALVLSYMMLFLYFTMAESHYFEDIPWFPLMLIVSFAFSGMLLFDTMRDGFGMAVGVLCLVLYTDSLLRWNMPVKFEEIYSKSCIAKTVLYAFLLYSSIHAVMAFTMGLSFALGFCFVLCVTKPPWQNPILEQNVFSEPHLHVFTLSILIGIWTLRHPRLIGTIVLFLSILGHFIPKSFTFTAISGLGCGYSHVIFIKLGFDTYIKFLNPYLKILASDRRHRRLVCYTAGIVPGVFIVYILGWRYHRLWYLNALFGLLFVLFVEICHAMLEGKVEAAPKATITNATKVLDSKSEASLKFVIRDFAGHPLYHSVHHIYMMGHCVYIIVFNFAEAKRNFKYCFAEIIYWLQAIFVHDRFPSVRTFIVGTHRDDKSLSKEDIDVLCNKILNGIPRQFYNMLVWNKCDDRPIFPVENSLRNPNDPDHARLREQLFSFAHNSMKPEYPIKYLYFYRVINECRDQGKLIETLENIEKMCKEHECDISGAGELEDLLCYFHECGEIIYNSYDNNQNQLVVLDPKALVSIMTSLVRAPPRYERLAEFMLDWNTVADLGICTRRLLLHIIEKNPLVSDEVSVDTVISLLEYLDLLCKLELGVDGRNVSGDECYLLIPLLKDTLPFPQNYWDDKKTDTIIYMDFGPVVPRFIFARFICQCTAESHIDIGTNGNYHLNVSTSKGLFVYRETISYKAELLDVREKNAPTQQLLKLVLRGKEQKKCLCFARKLCQRVCNIVERDFRRCRFKIGIMCPFEGDHDYCQYEEKHIFTLYENVKSDGSQQRGNAVVHLPEEKEFWCKGRRFNLRSGQVCIQDDGERRPQLSRQVSVLWDMNVLDLPPRLYSDICDDLNLKNPLGHDWRELAGQFGKSQRDVEILQYRSPRDPCDALLQDWASSSPNATIETLRQFLQYMGRLDVVRRIDDYVEGN
ncbi:hypothetical protein FSP39_004654 [Pinctada imbricata]|uniref:Death domain-containing protein n=1 Tax=Pinctada imbricata TaxID=66713 RepID=A0AA88Y918_PINIB|nr:hypothetical protein FSP39_004654 [Pinctada imbricata]